MRRWGGFLLCLLLSGGVWFVHMLSQTYSDLVSVPVSVRSNIEGRASVSSQEVTVSARCAATGYRLVDLSSTRKPRPVTIDASDFQYQGGDNFRISSSNLARYVPDLFGSDVTLESFVEDGFEFKFAVENHKTVPVVSDFTVVYRPQFMAMREVSLQPDSVVVYGDPSLLRHVDLVRTRQLSLYDVHSQRHGSVKLEAPKGVRLSTDDVIYSLDVTRFVEMPVEVTVGTVNVPQSSELLVFPPTAKVVCKCVFPLVSEDLSGLKLSIDYRDFASSISGRCIPACDHLPDGVIDWVVYPAVFDCVEQ